MSQTAQYDALMQVVRSRMTVRAFAPGHAVPREHYEMILEAARHSPSGANAQPWHFIVITEQALKDRIMEYFREEQVARAKLKMGFPTPNYNGVKTAPGLIVIVADFRFIRAFPVLNDGSDLDRLYKQNAERILLQSVAASTMSAHLAAAALGYAVWWITAIGQEDIQQALEEEARPDHELGPVRTGQFHDRGADRRVGQDDAPQGDVPGRVEDRLTPRLRALRRGSGRAASPRSAPGRPSPSALRPTPRRRAGRRRRSTRSPRPARTGASR